MIAELAQWENAGGKTSVTLELLEDGSVQVFYYDAGEDAHNIMDDSDYEAWAIVKSSALPQLAFALLAEKYSGNSHALSDFRAFCETNGIACESGVWT